MEKDKLLKNERQKKNIKQWNHDQRRDRVLLEKRQGILQISLNYKRKEQNNTKQWIQHRITDLLSKQAEISM